jgi:hypothetical protein
MSVEHRPWLFRLVSAITFLVILVASGYVAISLVEFYMVLSGEVQPGDTIYFDQIAPPLEVSSGRLMWGVSVILVTIVVRELIASRRQ